MPDYSILDNLMQNDAKERIPLYVGRRVTAEVYINNDLNGTKTIEGVCVNVYADTSFFDSIVYTIKENGTGKVYDSPTYYRREWHFPEYPQLSSCKTV